MMEAVTPLPGGRDPKTESWLQAHGVEEFEYRASVSIADIDRNAGKHNRARMVAVDEDRVIVLAEAVTSGDDLGPIVLYKRPRKRLLDVLDGNHRLEVYDLLDRRSTDAYIVTQELTETQEWFLIGTANRRHGLPSTLEDLVLWAINTVERFGVTQAEAARVAGIPAHKLSKRMAVIQGERRLTGLIGRNRVRRLAQSSVERLHSVRSDIVAKEAAELAAESKMPTEDVNRLVVALNKLRTEDEQLRLIQAARNEVQAESAVTAGHKVEIPLPYRRANRIAKTIDTFDFDELRETTVDSKLRKQTKLALMEAAQRLSTEVQNL